MKIYKYCGINYLIDNLKKNQLRLSEVNGLNDSYEGAHKYSISDEFKPEFLKLFYGEDTDLEKFDKLDLIENVVDEHRKTIDKEIGITCFSKTNKSLVMWGHYAEKQQGICLEFDSTKSIFLNLLNVNYDDEIYTININSKEELKLESLEQHGIKTCLNKSSLWTYEEEMRIIGDANTFINYDLDSLTGIYFGFKTPISVIREIFNETKHYKNLKYYRQQLSRERYFAKFDEVTLSDLKKETFTWNLLKIIKKKLKKLFCK